jgi:Mg2+-importing ATPase
MKAANQFPNHFWGAPVEGLFQALGSSSEGLNPDEATRLLEQYGPNLLVTKKQVTTLGLFLRQFQSPIVLILLFATLVSAFLRDWPDAVIILTIVMGSAVLSFVQEHNASRAAEKLRAQLTLKASVLRGGQITSIPAEQVVPGDVVLLSAGSLIPADGVVLEAKDFFVNQAVLTGETYPVEKMPGAVSAQANLAERTNTVFMGTNVRSGSAKALIVQTALHTAYGQIAGRLSLRPAENEFQRGIRHLGYLLGEVMFILVLAIFAFNVFFHKPVLDSLLFSIALAVGLTPQLLPAIININLSKGSQAMAVSGVIVRRLESIENFGSMDVLCTDKTGTLTLGVVQLDAALSPEGQASEQVLRLAYLNAHFQTGLSNPLDEAILSKAPVDVSGATKVDEIPYDFVRKRLSVIVQEDGSDRLVTKGALEMVLAVCTQAQADGRVLPMDANLQTQVRERYTSWSAQGYRVLGVASRPVEHQSKPYSHEAEREMVFAGFLLFLDPPKPGVQEAIQDLARFGVQLKIITGDNHLVARHTAEAVGLEVTGMLTGSQLDDLRDEALIHAAERANLFAEVDPNQKERIILALKKTGHVVGYMGDGINDAPSLHSADVGISVENAVDVAKEAADFVLLRPDLAVLHQGILLGRKTFANTLKYVFMATSANFGNMFSMAGASLILPFLPMLPKQILLINFLTDLPEMAIASDTVDEIFIERPHRWDVSFIRRFMLVFGPVSSAFDFLTFAVLLWGLKARPELFHTGWFVESVLSAALVVFALRTRGPFQHSKPSRGMLLATAGVALAALILPYTPLARLLGFVPLPPLFLLAVAAIVVVYFATAELTKRWFFKRFEG